MLKIWKNESKIREGYYYSASFYEKTLDGEELRKNINIDFQKGLEPEDNLNGEMIYRTTEGKEYNVMLKAFKKNDGTIEPKFFFWDQEHLSGNTNPINNDFNSNDDDLPF